MLHFLFDLLKWRVSRERVRRGAQDLMCQSGERAFFQAQNCAWSATSEGHDAEARFWQAVAAEVGRQVQRQAILTRIMTPSGAARPLPEGSIVWSALSPLAEGPVTTLDGRMQIGTGEGLPSSQSRKRRLHLPGRDRDRPFRQG